MQHLILLLVVGYISGCTTLPEQPKPQPEYVFETQSSIELPVIQPQERVHITEFNSEQNESSNNVKLSDPQEMKAQTEPSITWPTETGLATYYAASMQGRLTASGEPYDSEQLTAAHRTIPLGSLVRVTNSKNGNQVIVRINDRWAGGSNRIINLSKKAAEELALTTAGTLKVQLDVESLSQLPHPTNNENIQILPERIATDTATSHPRKKICQNEADILGLIGEFHRNHIMACLMRSE